jgi:ribosomal protein S18 acetylase RimI-like enzyme
MGSPAIRILKVSRKDQVILNHLTTVQCECLPADAPLEPTIGHWWLALEGEKTVGFACLKVLPGIPYGYLARAGVYSAYQGRGLQRKLITARERYARHLKLDYVISDTARTNYASSNSLIRCGYKLYQPLEPWAFADGNYWIKRL